MSISIYAAETNYPNTQWLKTNAVIYLLMVLQFGRAQQGQPVSIPHGISWNTPTAGKTMLGVG